jgi:hypothetical protein
MDAYDEIRAERARHVAKGRDAAHDDARPRAAWIECLDVVMRTARRVERPRMGMGGFRETATTTVLSLLAERRE